MSRVYYTEADREKEYELEDLFAREGRDFINFLKSDILYTNQDIDIDGDGGGNIIRYLEDSIHFSFLAYQYDEAYEGRCDISYENIAMQEMEYDYNGFWSLYKKKRNM